MTNPSSLAHLATMAAARGRSSFTGRLTPPSSVPFHNLPPAERPRRVIEPQVQGARERERRLRQLQKLGLKTPPATPVS